MHDEVAQHVLRAPLAFFHTNPTGRILNRFSKDQGTADDHLPQVAFDATQSLFLVAGKLLILHFTCFARFAVLSVIAHRHVCCFVYALLGIHFGGRKSLNQRTDQCQRGAHSCLFCLSNVSSVTAQGMQTFCLLMYCKILFQPACVVIVLLCTSLDHLYTLWSKHAERGLV